MKSTTAQEEFARALKIWFEQNDWPQIVPEKVAKAKGSSTGPWASQISNLMQGKLSPKPEFFNAMGWFNDVIASQDFKDITDSKLKLQLENSKAFCDDNKKPYSGSDFCALFIGEYNPPKAYRQFGMKVSKKSSASKNSLEEFSTAELLNELQRRNALTNSTNPG